jgi:hypothetical protein
MSVFFLLMAGVVLVVASCCFAVMSALCSPGDKQMKAIAVAFASGLGALACAFYAGGL